MTPEGKQTIWIGDQVSANNLRFGQQTDADARRVLKDSGSFKFKFTVNDVVEELEEKLVITFGKALLQA